MEQKKISAVIVPVQREESTLPEVNEKLLNEWVYSKNGELQPKYILATSRNTVWWKCPKGHFYIESINERIAGRGCPYCDHWKEIEQLANEKNPEKLNTWISQISKECIQSSNGSYVTRISLEKLNRSQRFKCKQGHFFRNTMRARFQGEQCPKCKKLQEKNRCGKL